MATVKKKEKRKQSCNKSQPAYVWSRVELHLNAATATMQRELCIVTRPRYVTFPPVSRRTCDPSGQKGECSVAFERGATGAWPRGKSAVNVSAGLTRALIPAQSAK